MKKEQTGTAEKLLKDLGRSIDELIAKAKDSKGDFKKEFKERIDELKKNRDTLDAEFKQFREDHAHDFEKFENSIQKVADEVKETLKKVFKKENQKK